MKIKDMFWKLFWLMLRGKGDARILFASEAVCFKAHMIEVDSAYFNPDGGSGLGDFLSLHWDSQVDQYVRIKGDIDDIQAVIKHINEEELMKDECFTELNDIDKEDLFELYTLTRKDRDETRLAYDVLSDEYDDLHRSYKDIEKELEELQITLMKILCVSYIGLDDLLETIDNDNLLNRQKIKALDNDPIIQKHIQIGFDININRSIRGKTNE